MTRPGAVIASVSPAPLSDERDRELLQQRKEKGKLVHCRFWGSAKGCRAGDACPFLHDASRSNDGGGGLRQTTTKEPRHGPSEMPVGSGGGNRRDGGVGKDGQSELPLRPATSIMQGRQYLPPLVPSGKIVAKPVPAQDPRLFQIGQVKRRYNAVEATATEGSTTVLSFTLHPSDPDFPFDLPKGLKCVLHVPCTYLAAGESGEGKGGGKGKPWLEVKNAKMGRGYQINVEKGFAVLVEQGPGLGLLGWLKELDKGLETMLGKEKADVVTFVPNVKPGSRFESGRQPTVQVNAGQTTTTDMAKPSSTQPAHTPAQLQEASSRREMETRQLEARLGRLPLFSKSVDGIAYTVPLAPRKPAELPVSLQSVKAVKLYVPLLYPLQKCRIELQGVSREAAKKTEVGFERRAKEEDGSNLMGHINWLAQNMHVLATAPEEEPNGLAETVGKISGEPSEKSEKPTPSNHIEDNRSHVIVIPRPPEWSVSQEDSDGSSDPYDSDEEFSADDDDDTHGVALPQVPNAAPITNPERGISLNFPNLELYSIELLDLVSLSITIKCERCKEVMDIPNLRSSVPSSNAIPVKPRLESCKKCASNFRIAYRHELIHPSSFRAGYLDLDACTVVDMLPSTFLPTCSTCSTTLPAPGMISVRGASTLDICRECHHKLSFQIPEIRFLLVSASSRSNNTPQARGKKLKENLGIVAGTELPRRGRCQHYSKSYRWFRFSCCSKVYACDRCHDEAESHPNEHANRMICGFCSREQNYRPDDCAVCHVSVVKKAGSGFWEGGKGTRDKVRMSRKDPRKFKRMPGGTARHA